jgi:hypothetical protein
LPDLEGKIFEERGIGENVETPDAALKGGATTASATKLAALRSN